MYKKGSLEGAVLVYVVILVVMIIIIILVLQVFTPYKITKLVGELLNSSEGINYARLI